MVELFFWRKKEKAPVTIHVITAKYPNSRTILINASSEEEALKLFKEVLTEIKEVEAKK